MGRKGLNIRVWYGPGQPLRAFRETYRRASALVDITMFDLPYGTVSHSGMRKMSLDCRDVPFPVSRAHRFQHFSMPSNDAFKMTGVAICDRPYDMHATGIISYRLIQPEDAP